MCVVRIVKLQLYVPIKDRVYHDCHVVVKSRYIIINAGCWVLGNEGYRSLTQNCVLEMEFARIKRKRKNPSKSTLNVTKLTQSNKARIEGKRIETINAKDDCVELAATFPVI